jgi:hypothetical protein
MDKALFDHTLEQLRGRATSDMVAFNALAIIEAFGRGEDPLAAAPKPDILGEAVAHKMGRRFREQPVEAPAEAHAEAHKKARKK